MSASPHPQQLSPAQAAAHDAAQRAGQAGYMDPTTGLFVLTTRYLADKRQCCGNGCRHCPYAPAEQQAARRRPVPAFPRSSP